MRDVSELRFFIITVDTEGDDQWHWHKGQPIQTENARYVERFQNLCEKYGIPPVYLINYEMARSDYLQGYLKEKAKDGLCEIGMHMHAWNSPPDFELNGSYDAQPYITEYPEKVILEKHRFLRDYIAERFCAVPVSYRSGRWATDERLWKVLGELGFQTDCSIVPGIVLNTPGATVKTGNNYKSSSFKPYMVSEDILEIPMTSAVRRNISGKTLKRKLKHLLKGEEMWLRPLFGDDMLKRLQVISESEKRGYLEAMVHSSELMPGGSPYIRTQDELENMYSVMESMFERTMQGGYQSVTLQKYGRILRG